MHASLRAMWTVLLCVLVALTLRFWPGLDLRFRTLSFSVWVVATVLLAFERPEVLLTWGALSTKTLIKPLLMVIMFGVGAVLEPSQFWGVFKPPAALSWGSPASSPSCPCWVLPSPKVSGFPQKSPRD